MQGLTAERLYEVLDLITWGYRVVKVDGKNYLFRPLTLEEQNIANIMYNDSIETLKEKGSKDKNSLRKSVIQSGSWSLEQEKNLELLKVELASIKEDIKKEKEANRAKRKASPKLVKLQNREEYVSDLVDELQSKYNFLIELPSVEHQSEMSRGIYYLSCATLTFPDKKQLWPTYQSCLDEEDRDLFRKLLNLYYTHKTAEEHEIRGIARSGYWRVKWINSRKNRGVYTLFGREMYDLTIDQYRLVQWSQIYDSAFESMDPPDDDVIEDDEKFDKWLDDQAKKRKQEKSNKSLSSKIDSVNSNAQEVGFTVDGFYSDKCTCGVKDLPRKGANTHSKSCPYGVFLYYKDKQKITERVEKIQSANPDDVRKRLAAEQRELAKHGPAEEQFLRNDPKTRAMFGMSTNLVGKDGKIRGKQ